MRTLGLFFLLAIFHFLAAIINKLIVRRPLINGAYLYLLLSTLLAVIGAVSAAVSGNWYLFGSFLGAWLIPALFAIGIGGAFAKKNPVSIPSMFWNGLLRSPKQKTPRQ